MAKIHSALGLFVNLRYSDIVVKETFERLLSAVYRKDLNACKGGSSYSINAAGTILSENST